MPKLDDASWHSGADNFPEDLPEESAATHIGFFVAWAIKNGLWGRLPGTDWSDAVQQVRNEVTSGRNFILQEYGGKFLSEMLKTGGESSLRNIIPGHISRTTKRHLPLVFSPNTWLQTLGRTSGKWRTLSICATRIGRTSQGGSFGRRSKEALRNTL
ncbi:hypothetical protein [Pseudorhodoferax sp. Leaf274]|uniref:DUF7832 domain-containing protein n=1 Tax=Pseudorhodoferax sp. Leaf274 TaxID=1736318 RepID=UPI0012E0F148|nr:hypothetical protein [Pseudorhodoferax sp. Leaf274]